MQAGVVVTLASGAAGWRAAQDRCLVISPVWTPNCRSPGVLGLSPKMKHYIAFPGKQRLESGKWANGLPFEQKLDGRFPKATHTGTSLCFRSLKRGLFKMLLRTCM